MFEAVKIFGALYRTKEKLEKKNNNVLIIASKWN